MMCMKYLVAVVILSLFLVGCLGLKEEVFDNLLNEIYVIV